MHLHILGICGTFMGGLAEIARAAGHKVTGCDANVYPPMSTQLAASGIDRAIRGEDNASDHAPVWIELHNSSRSGSRLRANKRKSPIAKPAPTTATRNPRPAKRSEKPQGRQPLLVIDGDSFAHRAYHALPKNIRRQGDKPAGAILGFANLLLRLYREEKPRAVLVGWDTYEEPTYRHEAFAAYQSGREFDDDVLEQLAVIPDFVAACGFANTKRAGYEADDFLAAAAAAEERRGGTVLIGGDFQGANPEIGNAQYTFVAAGAQIHADAIMHGPTSEVTPFRSNAFARMFEGYPG